MNETFGWPVEFQRNGNHGGTVKGAPRDVDGWIADYFRRYAPAGYGTQIDSDKVQDGVRIVNVFRGASCD